MGGLANFNHGSVNVTADAIIGVRAKPCRVFSATWLSDGTARDLVLRNGFDADGTIYVQGAGDASNTVTQNWEGGLLFPSGCFLDFTASAVSYTIEFAVDI